jgi:hypothetical protein
VTYTHELDAIEAVRKFDGCTTKGRRISVTRVSPPAARSHVEHVNATPGTKTTNKYTPTKMVRYIPAERRERIKDAPRAAVARGGKGRDGHEQKKSARSARPRKTIAELDEEMNLYFAGVQQGQAPVLEGQATNTMEVTPQMDDAKAVDVRAETMEVDDWDLLL